MAKKFPLHHPKDEAGVGCFSYEELDKLPVDSRYREALDRALKWTRDPSFYTQFEDSIPGFRRYQSRLLRKDLRILYKSKKLTKLRPRCSVRSFFVVEWAKRRRRPIFWPDLNEAILRSHLGINYIPLKKVVRDNGLRGGWSVQFDFKAWYDQLPLHHEIRKYFAFDGERCLTTLPMGFRPACEVAQAISLALADHDLPKGVVVDVYIDNVRFIGDREAVIEAGKRFVARCNKVGAILDSEVPEAKQLDTFLGEEYDYVQKRRRLASKTVEKVKYTHEKLLVEKRLTYRQISAIFGLLFFSAEVLALPMCLLFDIMKWFRGKMSEVDQNWSLEVDIPTHIREELTFWLKKIEHNPWTLMSEEGENDEVADLVLTVDACETGWGCMSTSPTSTQYFGSPWSKEEKDRYFLQSSVASEPLGAWRSICRFVATSNKKVIIYTDHQPQVWAMKRGIAKTETYNDLLVRLHAYYPNTKFEFRFISGEENRIADALSRFGKEVNESPIEMAE